MSETFRIVLCVATVPAILALLWRYMEHYTPRKHMREAIQETNAAMGQRPPRRSPPRPLPPTPPPPQGRAALTEHESAVVHTLADAWNAYCRLPVEHPMEADEFCRAIHAAQDKVLARAGRRAINAGVGAGARPTGTGGIKGIAK